MVPFTAVTGIAAPLIRDDINTDEITPIQIARTLTPDYAELLFMRTRERARGRFNSADLCARHRRAGRVRECAGNASGGQLG